MELKADNLSVGYGSDKVVFAGISFTAGQGEMIALLGVNGIGKSTLLRTLSGLQSSVSGSVTIGEEQIQNLTAAGRAKLLSIVLTERVFVDNITVKEFIALGRMPYTNWLGKLSDADVQEVEKVIDVMKISALQHKQFNHISDGEKQKALIARALCQQTPVIILDEPTAFLDYRNKKEILQLLSSIAKQLNKIVILSTHDIEASLEYCTGCWLMTEDKEFIAVNRSENFRQDVMGRLFKELNGHS